MTIKPDKTAPTATLSVTVGTAGTNGWYTSDVTDWHGLQRLVHEPAPQRQCSISIPDAGFRWSATEQQWIFNINTKGLGAGKTYIFRITLDDRTPIDFSFGLR